MNSRLLLRNPATRDTIYPASPIQRRQTDKGVRGSEVEFCCCCEGLRTKIPLPASCVCALHTTCTYMSLGALDRVNERASERPFSHIRLINVPLFFTLGSRPFAAAVARGRVGEEKEGGGAEEEEESQDSAPEGT